jgi:transcriptional regulator with XRE-family HTH domain
MLTPKEIGARIKQARQIKAEREGLKKFTQSDLAFLIDTPQIRLCFIETGYCRPTHIQLINIAKICGVPLDFFTDNNQPAIKAAPVSDPAQLIADDIIRKLDGLTVAEADGILVRARLKIWETAVVKGGE